MRDKITKPVPGEADFVKGTINGVQYRIVRHPTMGHLCGYVKVPRNHPWYARLMKKRVRRAWSRKYSFGATGHDALHNVNVHGGVTWSGHLPTCRQDRGYWVGFDCAHYDDFVPSMGFEGTYRDIEYVLAELRGLVSQMLPCSTAA